MSREAHVPFYEGLGVQFPRPTHRYCLSFRDVEDLLAERGIIVSYETIRQWCGKFGPDYARRLKRRQGRLGDTWFLDEVFVVINGQRQYLWRAVDQDGDLIDLLVQPRKVRLMGRGPVSAGRVSPSNLRPCRLRYSSSFSRSLAG